MALKRGWQLSRHGGEARASSAVANQVASFQVLSCLEAHGTSEPLVAGAHPSTRRQALTMRVIVSSAYGTWGDVSPLLQLTHELVQNDHQARARYCTVLHRRCTGRMGSTSEQLAAARQLRLRMCLLQRHGQARHERLAAPLTTAAPTK